MAGEAAAGGLATPPTMRTSVGLAGLSMAMSGIAGAPTATQDTTLLASSESAADAIDPLHGPPTATHDAVECTPAVTSEKGSLQTLDTTLQS